MATHVVKKHSFPFLLFPTHFSSVPLSVVSSSLKGIPKMTAYEKNGLMVEFSFERSPTSPTVIAVSLSATNSTVAPITDFLLQAAVPKVWCSPIYHACEQRCWLSVGSVGHIISTWMQDRKQS